MVLIVASNLPHLQAIRVLRRQMSFPPSRPVTPEVAGSSPVAPVSRSRFGKRFVRFRAPASGHGAAIGYQHRGPNERVSGARRHVSTAPRAVRSSLHASQSPQFLRMGSGTLKESNHAGRVRIRNTV
jgi:hypothetical protein